MRKILLKPEYVDIIHTSLSNHDFGIKKSRF